MDGHSGLEHRQVNQGGSGNFQLVLGYLKESTGEGHFIIHAKSNTIWDDSREFLRACGLQHFQGICQFYQDDCFWRHIGRLRRETHGFEDWDQTQLVHGAFGQFAAKTGELHSLWRTQKRLLETIGASAGHLPIFATPVEIMPAPADIPVWVNQIKFPELLELEEQRTALDLRIKKLSAYLPLVYASGDLLEGTVIETLRFLGLDAEKTKPGFTADILAQTSDGGIRFGFEVTGLSGPIKKDSPKLTQLLEFERLKERGEKTVLIANTYNTKPITERSKLESFTPQVVEFLGRHPILLMTGWNLYRMVSDCWQAEKGRTKLLSFFRSDRECLPMSRELAAWDQDYRMPGAVEALEGVE